MVTRRSIRAACRYDARYRHVDLFPDLLNPPPRHALVPQIRALDEIGNRRPCRDAVDVALRAEAVARRLRSLGYSVRP